MSTIQLQGIGIRNAVKASELKVGDVMICNFGYKQTFTSLVLSKTGKTINYEILCNGKTYTGRTTANRLFAIERVN